MGSELFDADALELNFGHATTVELEAEDTFCGYALLGFVVVGCLMTVDEEFGALTSAADHVVVPTILNEFLKQFCGVALDQLATAMFIVNVSPVTPANVGLVARHLAFITDKGAILNATVDEAGLMVATDPEGTAEFEVAVLLFGDEVGVGRHFLAVIVAGDHTIDHLPIFGILLFGYLPTDEGLAIEEFGILAVVTDSDSNPKEDRRNEDVEDWLHDDFILSG